MMRPNQAACCTLIAFAMVVSACGGDQTEDRRSPDRQLPEDTSLNIINGKVLQNSSDGIGAMARVVMRNNQVVKNKLIGMDAACTLTEIQDRCLLTAAHCIPASKPRNVNSTDLQVAGYRQHWHTRYGSSTDKLRAFEGHVIPFMRHLPHPEYSAQDESHKRAENDLALFWLKPWGCKLSGKYPCNIDDPNATGASFNVRALSYAKNPAGNPTKIGYGRDNSGRTGIKHQGQSRILKIEQSLTGAFFRADGEPFKQYIQNGDSGGPLLNKAGVFAVASQAEQDRFKTFRHELSTALFPYDNMKFVEIGQLENGDYGQAAKFCRPKPTLTTGVKLHEGAALPTTEKKIGGQDTALDELPKVNIELSDSLREYKPESFECGPGVDKSRCGSTVFIDVDLTAVPAGDYEFLHWQASSEYWIPNCPCHGSRDPNCSYRSAAAPWKIESGGLKCIAHFHIPEADKSDDSSDKRPDNDSTSPLWPNP